ncbi:MAG: hypothetical protein WCB18_10170 [Thermoplasmata archaeon]
MSWDSFFTAEVGATAALTGLLFVGITINLQRITALPTATIRAFQTLLILIDAFIIESLFLVPGQSGKVQGIEVLAVGIALWVVLNAFERSIWHLEPDSFRASLWAPTTEIQIPSVFAIVGGVALLIGSPSALYWFVPMTLASFLIAIFQAWVLTVEILKLPNQSAVPR